MEAQLKDTVKLCVDTISSESSVYKTRESINISVIELVANILETRMETLYHTKDQIKVDTSVSKVFENLWKKKQIYVNSASKNAKSDFDSIMEKFLSRDYQNPLDLTKFCQMIQKVKSIEGVRQELWILFAVDGLNDKEYKNYMRNLEVRFEFGDKPDNMTRDDIVFHEEEGPCVTHVRAIRSIYRFLDGVTPQDLRLVMSHIHDLPLTEDSIANMDSDDEEEMIQHRFIENYYRKLVGKKISNISSWLKLEMENWKKLEERRQKRKESISNGKFAKKRHIAEEKQ